MDVKDPQCRYWCNCGTRRSKQFVAGWRNHTELRGREAPDRNCARRKNKPRNHFGNFENDSLQRARIWRNHRFSSRRCATAILRLAENRPAECFTHDGAGSTVAVNLANTDPTAPEHSEHYEHC